MRKTQNYLFCRIFFSNFVAFSKYLNCFMQTKKIEINCSRISFKMQIKIKMVTIFFILTLLPWTNLSISKQNFLRTTMLLGDLHRTSMTSPSYIVSGRKMTFSWFLARLVSYAHIPVSGLPAFCRRLYAAPPHSADPITIRNSSWILNLLVIVNWDPFLSWNRGRLASCSPYLHMRRAH